MSQPPIPLPTDPSTDGSPPSAPRFDAAGAAPPAFGAPPGAGTDAGPQWTAPPAPSWSQPWQWPAPPVTTVPPVTGPPLHGRVRSGGRVPLVLAAVLGVLVGAVGAGFLVTALFIGSAQDIGQEIGKAMTPAVEEGISDGLSQGMTQQLEDAMSFLDEGMVGGYPTGPVEQFPPIEPEDLDPDPVLDAYADGCFEGELQSCDDLYSESPPLSRYEEYAGTCGGRVKAFAVAACTELE